VLDSGHVIQYVAKRCGPAKEFFEQGEFDSIPKLSATPAVVHTVTVHTASQSKALTRLEDLARAYFSDVGRDLPLKPRYNALLVAATGSGKTKIATDLADRIGAKLHTISLGEWNVLGAQGGPASVTTLLRVLEKSERVVLLLDELDKFTSTTDSSWTRYAAAEIWALLDRRLPIEQHCLKTSSDADVRAERIELLRHRVQKGLFIVGAGTFQAVWQQQTERRSCGFNGASSGGTATDAQIIGAVRSGDAVSPELLSRFSPTPILLRYPTREETATLLETLGINRLASEVGATIDPNIDYTGVGMRALEQICAELLIEKAKLAEKANPHNAPTRQLSL
jgi:hypothetical protein